MSGEKRCALGIDLGATFIKLAIVSSDGKVLKQGSAPTFAERGRDVSVGQIINSAKDFLKSARESGLDPIGVGIGSPGLIDTKRGIVVLADNFAGWVNVPLRQTVRDGVGLPAWIGNDVNVMALAEARFGAGSKFQHFVCVTLGTGVGGAVVIDRKVFEGATGTAGEIGHTNIDPNGPVCGCGNRGCLEAYVGNRRIIERALGKITLQPSETILPQMVNGKLEDITPKIISEAAEKGDKIALEILRETGEYIGIIFASLISFLNPEAFVVGGGVSNAGELIFGPIRETINRRALEVPRQKVAVVPATMGEDSNVIGAALLVEGF